MGAADDEGHAIATTFSYELSTYSVPEQAKARLQPVLSERLLRPAVGSAGSNLECALRLSRQTATSLTYTPKLRVPAADLDRDLAQPHA